MVVETMLSLPNKLVFQLSDLLLQPVDVFVVVQSFSFVGENYFPQLLVHALLHAMAMLLVNVVVDFL